MIEEKELFEDYEIKNWDFTPRLFKTFGAGAILTILTVFAFGQFNLAQTKACDNAIVGTFCQVLDAAYVAATFSKEDGEWASWDAPKTKIEDADITYVDVSAVEPPLKYPEGYFALANPEQYSQLQNPTGDVMGQPFPSDPSFPNTTFPNPTSTNPTSGTDLLNKPAELPKQLDNAVKGEVPDSPFTFGDDSTTAKVTPNRPKSNAPPRRRNSSRVPRPEKSPTPDANELANTDKDKTEPSPTPTDPASAIGQFNQKINKVFLTKFADEMVIKTEGTEKIDLTKPFMVEMQGVLDKDGKLDPKKSRFIDDEGDPNMINVAKSAIEAVNDSGLLSYLRDQGVEKINFVLVQNDKELTAVIKGGLANEDEAKKVSSGINALIGIAKFTNRDDDLKKIMEAAKFTTDKKDFVMNFVLKKQDAHTLINKKLQEARLKKSQNSSGEVSSNANAKGK